MTVQDVGGGGRWTHGPPATTLSHVAEGLRILDTEEVASPLLGPLMIFGDHSNDS